MPDMLPALAGFLLGAILVAVLAVRRERAIRADNSHRQRSVLKGQVGEQLAPYLPGFPWRPSEARFIGKPVDFIVFDGLDEGEIRQVVLVEVKTGDARLNRNERSLRACVKDGRVDFAVWRLEEQGEEE